MIILPSFVPLLQEAEALLHPSHTTKWQCRITDSLIVRDKSPFGIHAVNGSESDLVAIF